MRGRVMAVAFLLCALCPVGTAQEETGGAKIEELVADLKAESYDTVAKAADALRALGDGAAPATDSLVELLDHGRIRTRTAAYETLAGMGPSVAPRLLEELKVTHGKKGRERYRAWVGGVLWELGEQAADTASAWLDDKDTSRVLIALEVLPYTIGDTLRAGERVLALTEHKRESLRRAAFKALRAVGQGTASELKRSTVRLSRRNGKERRRAARIVEAFFLHAVLPSSPPPRPDSPLARSIRMAQNWLVAHQRIDGCWSAATFDTLCPEKVKCTGKGQPRYDTGVTAIALLGLLPGARDHRIRAAGDVAHHVRRGLHFLLAEIRDDGCLTHTQSAHFMYIHGAASLALAEAYATTGNPLYRYGTEQAVKFIEASQNPYLGWRYVPRGRNNDTSVTGWMTAALLIADSTGIAVDPEALPGSFRWFRRMTDPKTGRVGYQLRGGLPARTAGAIDHFPGELSESLTAITLHCHALAGQLLTKGSVVEKQATLCRNRLPTWNPSGGNIDYYYWMHASMALHRLGGKPWSTWRQAMRKAALAGQRKEFGPAPGSWDPISPWGEEGGRVYSTAAMLTCLETVSDRARHTRIRSMDSQMKHTLSVMTKIAYGDKELDGVVRTIAKRLVDRVTGNPKNR